MFISGTINGERILPRRTPKKLPRRKIKIYNKIFVVINILPIAIEFANERCFSENHTKLNFVGINKIKVWAKAHKNCPKISHLFSFKTLILSHSLPLISITNLPVTPNTDNTLKHRTILPIAFIQVPINIY